MRVAFLCPSLSRELGGVFEVERNLAKSLAALPDTTINVLGVEDQYTQSDLPGWLPVRPTSFPPTGRSGSFRYSPALQRAFLAVDSDLVHLHSLWTHNSVILNRWHKRLRRPYVVTVHGMLDRWAVRNSAWKKRIALALYERRCLIGAGCIHASSQAEFRAVRDFGLSNPVCIVPNGIDLPSYTNTTASPFAPGRKTLLYLGRLHPKKGLPNLLKAWSQVRQAPWSLAIAGWDQSGHELELRALATSLSITSSVDFLGPQFGDAKNSCYRHCDAFILPSLSEGLPMVVLEAWSYGKPVLMTSECNLPEGFSSQAAIKLDPTVDSIAAGLKSLFAMSDDERGSMGAAGFTLAKRCFSWPKIAQDLRSVYAWMLGAASQPGCVVTN